MRGDSLTEQKWLWTVGNVFNREVNIGIFDAVSILYQMQHVRSVSPFSRRRNLARFNPGHVLWSSMSDSRPGQGDAMATYAHDP